MKSLSKILLVLLIFLVGCQCNRSRKNIDVTGITVNLEVRRFDQDLFIIDPENPQPGIDSLMKWYPEFFPFYLQQVMRFGNLVDPQKRWVEHLVRFLSNPYIQGLKDTCAKKFADFGPVEQQLTQAFKHYKYYYPGKEVPQVITVITEFGHAAFTVDSTILAIGLDMYLGRDYVYYPNFFPNFLIRRLTPEYIPVNSMQVMATMLYGEAGAGATVLERMIHKGKVLYFTELMLPQTPDSLIIGYTAKQIEWCRQNEPEIWAFLIDKKLLYETNPDAVRRVMADQPTTPGMPPESPGSIGSWVGWQIVRKFARENPDVSLHDLMSKYDARTILMESRYKPKRALL